MSLIDIKKLQSHSVEWKEKKNKTLTYWLLGWFFASQGKWPFVRKIELDQLDCWNHQSFFFLSTAASLLFSKNKLRTWMPNDGLDWEEEILHDNYRETGSSRSSLALAFRSSCFFSFFLYFSHNVATAHLLADYFVELSNCASVLSHRSVHNGPRVSFPLATDIEWNAPRNQRMTSEMKAFPKLTRTMEKQDSVSSLKASLDHWS